MLNNHISIDNLPQFGDIGNGNMETLNLETTSRLNQQLNKLEEQTLNPETATFDDLAIHAKTEQYLSNNTIKKRIRYLKYMETHEYPVDLRKAEETQFKRHIRYRLYYENPPGTIDACRHEKLAFNMLRKAYGLPIIELKLPRKQQNKKMIIPTPDIVREFWHYPYYKNKNHARLFQYMMRMSFLIGMRPPSELANLREQDLIFNNNGTAILTIHEDKENNRERTIILDNSIATDPQQKTMKHWMETWRPRLIRENCDAIFPKRNGDYWTAANLGKYLRINGKNVWPHYHPYVSRHWSCCARLIEQYHTTNHWNTLVVKEWHGHDKIKNTEKYIKYARQYYQIDRSNWIQRVLKAPYIMGEENPLKSTNTLLTSVSNGTPSREQNGRGHTQTTYILQNIQQKTISDGCRFNPFFHFSFFTNWGDKTDSNFHFPVFLSPRSPWNADQSNEEKNRSENASPAYLTPLVSNPTDHILNDGMNEPISYHASHHLQNNIFFSFIPPMTPKSNTDKVFNQEYAFLHNIFRSWCFTLSDYNNYVMDQKIFFRFPCENIGLFPPRNIASFIFCSIGPSPSPNSIIGGIAG